MAGRGHLRVASLSLLPNAGFLRDGLVGTVNQEATNAGRSHFSEGELLSAHLAQIIRAPADRGC
jgi:hypothetical protein